MEMFILEEKKIIFEGEIFVLGVNEEKISSTWKCLSLEKIKNNSYIHEKEKE